MKQLFWKYRFFIGASSIFLIAVGFFFILAGNNNQKETKPQPTPSASLISPPHISPTILPTPSTIPSTIPKKIRPSESLKTPIPTINSPTSAPPPTATAVPHIANPPIAEITYPTENQQIDFNIDTKTLCVLDLPKGGNQNGLQRRDNLRNMGWSSYSKLYTFCFSPNEGINIIQFQYKNIDNEESGVYTRQFSIRIIKDITVSISGQIYLDQNCNKTKDAGETGIPNIGIDMYRGTDGYSSLYGPAHTTSDSNGNYSLSDIIKNNESINFAANAFSHTYSKTTALSFISLSSSRSSATQDIGMTLDSSCTR